MKKDKQVIVSTGESPFERIKHDRKPYVYMLAYPESMGGAPFYVGKGIGDRINHHEEEARSGVQSRKCGVIRETWGNGEEVSKTILAFFDTKLEALRYEASLIDSMEGLSNVASGRKNIKDTFLTDGDKLYFGHSVRRIAEDGSEYYDAREVRDFFGYINWSSFSRVIGRARKHCRAADIPAQFISTSKVVTTGKGSKRAIVNYRLCRLAFLMVLMNSDSTYPVVEAGKNYIVNTVAQFDNGTLREEVLQIDTTVSTKE